ncbi:MAG: amidohydrolase family protein [Proteobacteria bacterium]|nr:amidohydrolase family protein [Pseudomonadota bacterium]
MRISHALAALGLAAALLPPPPAAAAEATTVVKARRLFDGITGRLTEPGLVVVQGERIVGVGAAAQIPEGAQVIDLGDATLLPGFIDAHVHITDEASSDPYRDFYEGMLRLPAEQAYYAEKYARATLAAGFTTVRVVGAGDWVDVALRNGIAAGLVEGPRILTAAHAIGSPGGHCDQPPFPPERVRPLGPIEGVCSGPESCREAVREQMKWGADVIKICASGGVLSEADPLKVPQLTAAELEAIVGEAHRWGRKVAAHSHGDEAARLAVEAGVDSIEHGTFLTADTLRLMKQRGTYLVPTRLAAWWSGRHADTYPPPIARKAKAAATAGAEMMKTALRIGVPIAFGTDSGVSPHGLNAREFSLLVADGMTPAAALLAATRDAAKLLGVDGQTGSLESGKSADLVAVPGNVLENIAATEHPVFVMARGHVFGTRP